MDLEHLLVWLVGASCLLSLLRVLAVGVRSGRGWLVICGGLLLLLALLLGARPELAAAITTPLWVVLVLLPSLGSRVLAQAILRRRFRLALPLSRMLALLHPFDGWLEQPDVVAVLALHHQGQGERAASLVAGRSRADTLVARTANLLEVRARGAWGELVAWLASRPGLLRDPTWMGAWLRGLGELGRRREMLAAWVATAPLRRRWSQHLLAQTMRLQVAALAGRRRAVELLCDGPLAELPADTRTFWLATAEQVAGRTEVAADLLSGIVATSGHDLRREVERRVASPLPSLAGDELDAAGRAALDELAADLEHERRFAVLGPGGPRRPWATFCVAALLLAVFLLELRGGSQDHENLVALGALVVPTSATPGEWWRRVTAGFLHFGPAHLLLNVLALLYLGRCVERAWGPLAFLACTLLATLVSTALFPELVRLAPGEQRYLVGASGGVFGLLGALLGHSLVGSLRRRTAAVVRELGVLALLVACQLVFDLATPEVSSLCHALGLLTGLLFGLLVGQRTARAAELALVPS